MSELALHHVGIIVPDRERAEQYVKLFGLPVKCDEYVPAFNCDCIFVGQDFPCVELVIPHGGQLARFNDGAGGLHHYAFQTQDLRQYMRTFAGGKGRWLHPSPVEGARGMLVNFLSVRNLHGMTEFVEEAS